MNLKQKIKDLVAENRNDEVIDSLLELSRKINNKELSNSVIMLSAKYENFLKETMQGIVNHEEKNVTLSKLNLSILNLIDSIPDRSFSEAKNLVSKENGIADQFDNNVKKMKTIVILVLLIGGALGVLISGSYLIYLFMLGNAPEFRPQHLIPVSVSLISMLMAWFLSNKNK